MSKKFVRAFALVLVVLMCLSLLPLAARADEGHVCTFEPTTIPPTCGTNGYVQMICPVCGNGGEIISTIPPTGEHHFESIVNDDYLIEDSDDPCVKPALYWKSCVNYVDENGTICGASAEEAHTQALEKLYEELNQRKDQGEEHTDAEWQKITEDAVKEIDAKYTFTVGGEGHSWVSYERQEATCTDNGWEAYRQCSVCGVIDGEYPVIPAKGHRWGEFAVVIEPTCTEEGRRERECEVCGEKESESIPAKGHSWGEYAVITAPTCTGEGVKEHTCTACGATETASIPALGHTWGAYVVTKEPTCTEDGEQTRTCTVCGATETASVPALGHRFGAYVVTKEPTCTADGEQTRTCTVCGATETAPVPALGHRFGAYVVTKEPTCTVDGEQTRTCTVCGEKETELIPAGHKWGEYIVTVEPGCYSSGERERTCTACGAKEKEAIAPAHKFGEWVVTMEPTCYSTGEEVSTCTVCGATESRWLDKAHKYVDGECVFCGEADPSAAPAVSGEEANTEPEENNTEENNTEENTGNIDGNETPADEPAAEEQPAADAPYEGIKNADAVKNGEVVDEAYVGNVLTVAVTPANHEYVYQWYRMTDEGPVEIPGAYDKSYRLTEEDLGSEVYCFVADEEMSDATTYAVAVLPADQDPNPAADEAEEQAADDEAAAGEKPASDKKPLPKVKQEASSDETIASFTEATGIKADPASITAQNVTPVNANGEKLDNDAVAAAGGVTFEMPLPESYKPGDPIEIYHQNSETGEWELITNYTIIDNKVIIREQKNFSAFIVVDMEEAETFNEPISSKVTLWLNANGGSGALSAVTGTKGGKYTLPNRGDVIRQNHTLMGWNSRPDGSGVHYDPGADYTFFDDETLYAEWDIRISYYPNATDATGGPMPSKPVNETNYQEDVVLDKNLYVRPGYIWYRWTTDPEGNERPYGYKEHKDLGTGEDYVTITAPSQDMDLYVQWAKEDLRVMFIANDGTNNGTDMPAYRNKVLPEQPIHWGDALTLPANTYKYRGTDPTDEEYDKYDFQGWNTRDDGTGVFYADGTTIPARTFTEDTYLYAQWAKTKYKVSYNPNTGNDGAASMPDTAIDTASETSLKLDKNKFEKTGYSFVGWNTEADGSGTSYGNEASIPAQVFLDNGDLLLYAQWSQTIYTIQYDANPGDGTTVTGTMPTDEKIDTSAETEKRLTKNAFTYDGFRFTGWNTKADGTGKDYTDEAVIPASDFTENLKLYAQWEQIKFKVEYNPNGGSGSIPEQEINTTTQQSLALTKNNGQITKVQRVFVGWNTKADGSGKDYSDGEVIPAEDFTEDLYLYAQWKTAVVFDKNHPDSTGTMEPQEYKIVNPPEKIKLDRNAFELTNYEFDYWSEKPEYDDSTTHWADEGDYVADDSRTLYAHWKKAAFSVFYEKNNGGGSQMPDTVVSKNGAGIVEENQYTAPNASKVFGYWEPRAVEEDGTTVTDPVKDINGDSMKDKYVPGDEIRAFYKNGDKNTAPVNIVMKAIWVDSLEVTYYPGNAEGSYKIKTVAKDVAVKLPTPTSLDFTPYDGQTFAGWEIEGKTGLYKSGDEYAFNAPTKVTAQWAKKIKVSFDPNGGTGSRKAQEIPQGVPTNLATMEKIGYSRSGYEFKGWYTTPNIDPDSPKLIPDGGTVTFTYDTELYAIWKKHVFTGEVTISGSSTGSAAHAYVGETLTAKVTGDKVFKNYAYQWLADGEEIPGATSDTYDVQAEDFGKEITVAVTALDAEATDKKVQLSKNSKTVTMEDENLVKDIVDNGKTESAYVVGVAKGMTYTFNSTDKSTGMPVDSHLVIKDGVTVFPFTIQGVYRFYDKDGGLVSTVEVRNWYQLSFDVTNHISTSSSSSTSKSSGSSSSGSSGSSSSSSSGSGTVVMKNGNTQLTATSRIPDAVNPIIQGKGTNLWWVREGAETNITMIVKPASNSYASYSLNGSSYASIGSGEKTIKVSPITKSMHYEIAFYSTSASPKTADMSHIGMWSALCFTSLVGASAILTRSRRRRKNEN